jgi:hypothetical protein
MQKAETCSAAGAESWPLQPERLHSFSSLIGLISASLQPRVPSVVFNLEKRHGNQAQRDQCLESDICVCIPTLMLAWTLILRGSLQVTFHLCMELGCIKWYTRNITKAWNYLGFWRKNEAAKRKMPFFLFLPGGSVYGRVIQFSWQTVKGPETHGVHWAGI